MDIANEQWELVGLPLVGPPQLYWGADWNIKENMPENDVADSIHRGLKIPRLQVCAGSSPAPGTRFY